MDRRLFIAAGALATLPPARAHHGWSSFDQARPIYLEGRAAKVSWRNPHVELEALPAQSAPVDGAALLKAAQLPTRKDRRWHVELAPLTRMEAWKVPEIKPGDALAMLGFTFAGEKGDAVIRVEYLFAARPTRCARRRPERGLGRAGADERHAAADDLAEHAHVGPKPGGAPRPRASASSSTPTRAVLVSRRTWTCTLAAVRPDSGSNHRFGLPPATTLMPTRCASAWMWHRPTEI